MKVAARFVVGTESEGMSISPDGIDYGPSGRVHVVDTKAPDFRARAAVGYAACGRPVRVWHDRPIADGPQRESLDAACAAALRRF